MKLLFAFKLLLATLASALLFGCALPTKTPSSRGAPPVAQAAPRAAQTEINQEAALDKNEVILDKPAPVQTEVQTLIAKITSVQQSRITQALNDASANLKTTVPVSQAAPKLRAFIERLSCIRQYNDGGSAVIQNMAAPGVSFKYFVPPMHGTKNHNKNTCLTVTSIQLKPLSYQGLAAIQVKVLFQAEDSGETTSSNHEINKSRKGVWWFTR